MAYGFRFNGRHSSEFGILVNKVSRSILPPLTDRSIKIPARDGTFHFGTDVGVREFKIEITYSAANATDLLQKARDIGRWLLTDEEAEIIFDQEPDKSYYGFLVGNTDIESLVSTGFTTFTIQCPDPYAYGAEIQSPTYTSSPITVTTTGQEDTYPMFTATFNTPATFFSISDGENYVHVGSPSSAETTSIPKETRVLQDNGESTAQWLPYNYADNATITGTIDTNGWALYPSSYGSASGWHGAAIKRMIGTPITDFRMESWIKFSSSAQKEKGRIEIYMLDPNGVDIGKIAIKDIWDNEDTMVEARAGRQTGGYFFVDYIGTSYIKKRKQTVKKKVKGKYVNTTETITEGFSRYSDFYGKLMLERIGQWWKCYIIRLDFKTGKELDRFEYRFYDSGNSYNQQVAGVAIHFGQYGTEPVINSALVSAIELYQINTVTQTDIPLIFQTGDVLTIDCESGAVYKNGERFLSELNIGSKFFSLSGGTTNNLAFEPQDKCNLVVYHRGRYL